MSPGFHPQYQKPGDTGKGRINICHLILEFVDRSLIKLKVIWEKESNAVRLKGLMRKTVWWWQPWEAVLRRPGCMPVAITLTTGDQTQILLSHCEEVNSAFFWWSTSRPLAAGPLTFGQALRMPCILLVSVQLVPASCFQASQGAIEGKIGSSQKPLV